MSAKDIFHENCKQALLKDGWSITNDPLRLEYGSVRLEVDLGAERVIAAQRGSSRIAVEVKSFVAPSVVKEFHAAVGQYLHYRLALKYNQSVRQLFLAVPIGIYEQRFGEQLFQDSIQEHRLKLIVFDPFTEEVLQWSE